MSAPWSRARPLLLFVALLLAFLAAPLGAGASSTASGTTGPEAAPVTVTMAPAPTTLFAHLNGFQDFVLTTQEPDEAFREDEPMGIATTTLTCLPVVSLAPTVVASQPYHSWWGYGTPERVEYDVNGTLRFHPTRGVPQDVRADASEPITMTWYLSTGRPTSAGAVPAVMPQVTVRATLRSGDEISVGHDAFEAGAILAQGTSAPALLAKGATNGAVWSEVDGSDVYAFTVPMRWVDAPVITAATGYNLRIDVFESVPGCTSDPDASVMANVVQAHSSPGHRPRLELTVLDPIVFVAGPEIAPIANSSLLRVDAALTSPWGRYDVAEAQAYLQGPEGLVSLGRLETPPVVVYEHGQAFQPMVLSWVIDRAALAPGAYQVKVQATASQGAHAVAETAFRVEPDEPVPATSAALAALGLVAVAFVLRRRV